MATAGKTATHARRVTALLAGIVLVAFALRAYGVGFGLPHLYYWDEPTIVKRAIRFGSGDLNPHFFFYPAFYMYVLAGVSGAYYAVARLTGHFASTQDFAVEFFTAPTNVYLCARVTTALVGAATVAVVYRVGSRFFGKRVGLAAAAILAVSVLHASYSHIAITDVPHAFFILAAYLPIHAILTRSRRGDYVLAGSLIGLGMATKYLAVLLVPTLLVAHFLRDGRPRPASSSPLRALARDAVSPGLLLGFVAIGISFFVASPYNVLSLREFLSDYVRQAGLSKEAAVEHPVLLYIQVFLLSLGWPICLAALVGLVEVVRLRSRALIVFLSFPVVYLLVTGRMTRVFGRYMVPEDPFVAILAAVGVVTAARLVPMRFRSPAIAGITALLCVFPVVRLLGWDAWMASGTDPRTAATAWAESHLPSGTVVAVQPMYERTFYNAPLLTDAEVEQVGRDIPSGGRFGPVRDRVLAALEQRHVFTRAPWVDDVGALAREGARYVFVSSLTRPPLDPAFIAQLETGTVATQVFAPSPAGLEGLPVWPDVVPVMPPTITVYEMR